MSRNSSERPKTHDVPTRTIELYPYLFTRMEMNIIIFLLRFTNKTMKLTRTVNADVWQKTLFPVVHRKKLILILAPFPVGFTFAWWNKIIKVSRFIRIHRRANYYGKGFASKWAFISPLQMQIYEFFSFIFSLFLHLRLS